MATIELTVPDESMLAHIKKVCMMIKGVASVKVNKEATKRDVTKTASYREAMEDVKKGRIFHAESTEEMFRQILG